jgi:hypothetical protein
MASTGRTTDAKTRWQRYRGRADGRGAHQRHRAGGRSNASLSGFTNRDSVPVYLPGGKKSGIACARAASPDRAALTGPGSGG